ncbi:MAG: glycosyltransferase, partial [Solirubrobacteraceae bacterium]
YGIRELWARPERALVLVPEAFDAPGRLQPTANVRYVGPLRDPGLLDEDDPLPWGEDDRRPLVLISLSSTIQIGQADLMQRILDAVDPSLIRCLLALGKVRPEEVEVPAGVVARPWVSHAAVLPQVHAVVNHGGVSTVLGALGHGVPLLCLPLGRDQPNNAARLAAVGAGLTLKQSAKPTIIGAALTELLADERYRVNARWMQREIAGYGQGERVVAELEELLATTRRSFV